MSLNKLKRTSYQDLFDMAWLGLKAQGFNRSLSSGDTCRYLSDNGLRCAIGHCISEKTANEWDKLESTEQTIQVIAEDTLSPGRVEFLAGLQFSHDQRGGSTMPNRLIDFAKKYKLTIPGGY